MGAQCVVGLEHLADVKRGGEGPAGLHILVVMGDVGGEDDPAAASVDADELHTRRVAAHRVQTDARRKLGRPVVELDPAGQS